MADREELITLPHHGDPGRPVTTAQPTIFDYVSIVEIWTDGASSGTSLGAGGYAAIVRCDGDERVLVGGSGRTTNQRMELMGPIVALESLTAPRHVVLYSDSIPIVWRTIAATGSPSIRSTSSALSSPLPNGCGVPEHYAAGGSGSADQP
jgi:hypothetical protein